MGAWGEPGEDGSVQDGWFCFRVVRAGNLLVTVQPDRGRASSRKAEYHDTLLPPRHGYVAFYLWLRMVEQVHGVIHCGTHGTLEWLPGKATALSDSCGPRAVLGPLPLIYPFIVNNPGEAAQAKRARGGGDDRSSDAASDDGRDAWRDRRTGRLFDEYAQAQGLDRRRAERLRT